MNTRRICVAILGLALSSSACGSDEAPATTGTAPIARAAGGSIAGRVRLSGPVPTATPVRMGADDACLELAGSRPLAEDTIVASDGAVANAFVYIKDGLDRRQAFPNPTTPVVLDQRGCQFVPRVLGVQVGQPVEVLNSDPTLHDVHAMPQRNVEFNRAQPEQGMRETRIFSTPEVMIHIKCDVHPWMAAYIGVMDHPFFAVTGADGAFDLTDVPPGHYTVEVWHERLGTKTDIVDIEGRESRQIALTFAGS